MRDDDSRRDPQSRRGKTNRLTVIATSGGDDALQSPNGSPKLVEVHKPAANLERPNRRVILVLDPDVAAAALIDS